MLLTACGKELKIEVYNEDGTPVSNADVKVDYVDGGSLKTVEGKTNQNGIFISQGEEVTHRVELFVTKDGYYPSKFRHRYANALSNKAEGLFKLTLRKKGVPAPMYAKRVDMIFPTVGNEYGFDLEKGDWVQPHGQGKKNDIFFLVEKKVTDRFNRQSRLKVRFGSDHDGILIDESLVSGSVYQQEKMADPEAVFGQEIEIHRVRSSNKMNYPAPKHNYVFRARSKMNKQGDLMSANYGRILGGIYLATGYTQEDGCAVRFTYFYNPKSNDFNLEFDRKLNLFTDLKREELISERQPSMKVQ
jgi:hypothetical protein